MACAKIKKQILLFEKKSLLHLINRVKRAQTRGWRGEKERHGSFVKSVHHWQQATWSLIIWELHWNSKMSPDGSVLFLFFSSSSLQRTWVIKVFFFLFCFSLQIFSSPFVYIYLFVFSFQHAQKRHRDTRKTVADLVSSGVCVWPLGSRRDTFIPLHNCTLPNRD